MNDSIKVIAEFVDNASSGLKSAGDAVKDFYQGLIEGAKAELAAVDANKKLGDSAKDATPKISALAKEFAVMAVQLYSAKQLIDAFVQSMQAADKLDDLSQKTGIASSTLNELGFAAKVSGSSLDGLISAFDKLNRTATASEEETSKQAIAFKAVGVSATEANGSVKDSEQLFLELADAFKGLEDGPEKSAAAFRIFGTEGKNLLPMLNLGSAGIKKLREEAVELGGMGKEAFENFTAASGDMFDNLDKLSLVFSGMFNQMSAELVPILNVFIEELIDSGKEGGLLRDIVDGIVAVFNNGLIPVIKLGAIALHGFTSVIKIAAKGLGALGAAMVALLSGDFAGAKNIMSSYGDDVAKVAGEHVKFQEKLALAGHSAVKLSGSLEKPRTRIVGLGKAAKEAKSELQGMLDALSIANNSFGKDESEKQLLEAQLKYSHDLIKFGKTISDQRLAAVKVQIELNKTLREEAEIKERIKVATATMDTTGEALAISRAEVEAAGKTADERERIVQAMKDEFALAKLINGVSEAEATLLEERFFAQTRDRDALKEAAKDAKIINEIVDGTRQAIQDDVSRHLVTAARMLEAGKLTLDDYNSYQTAQLKRLKEVTKAELTEMQTFWQGAGKGMQSDMETFLFDAMQGKLNDLGAMFKQTIDRMVAQALAAKLAKAMFGDMQTSGDVGGWVGQGASAVMSMFAGARASGGPVQAGRAYMVGERGPEPFIPSTAGTILPNSVLQGSGQNISISITAIDSKDFLSKMSEVKREVADMMNTTNRSYRLKGA